MDKTQDFANIFESEIEQQNNCNLSFQERKRKLGN